MGLSYMVWKLPSSCLSFLSLTAVNQEHLSSKRDLQSNMKVMHDTHAFRCFQSQHWLKEAF